MSSPTDVFVLIPYTGSLQSAGDLNGCEWSLVNVIVYP